MKKYKVYVPYILTIVCEVEAKDLDDAVDQACQEEPEYFCGNGGCDKLVGVIGDHLSIEVGEGSAELMTVPDIIVEEI